MLLYIIIFFLFGLILGSFANVCIYRIPKDESIVFPSSHCPECNTSITWYDNIPVVSYLLLRGKCRGCNQHIPLQYPAVELTSAILTSIVCVRFYGDIASLLAYVFFTLALLILTVIDMKHQIIPDSLNLFIFIIAIIFSFFNPVFGDKPFARFLVSLGSAVLLGVIFIFVSYLASLIFKKEALGGGDIKLICAMSALLGIQRSFMAIFLASLSGSVIGILLILSKRKARGEYIPFGPFLAFGAYLALLLPDTFLIW